MKEKCLQLKPKNRLILSKKFLIISVVLFYAYIMLNILTPILRGSSDIEYIWTPIVKGLLYGIALLFFKQHTEVFLIPIIFNFISNCFSPLFLSNIKSFSILYILGVVIEIAFCSIFVLALYKDIPLKITKIATSVRLIFIAYQLFTPQIFLYGFENIWGVVSSLIFETAIFLVFFFSTREKNEEKHTPWNKSKTLYLISAILFIISIVISSATSMAFMVVELITMGFVIVGAIWLNSWKFPFESFATVLLVAMIIGLVVMIGALIVEGPNVKLEWQEEWHTCMKCNGSGKVRNDLGYYVTCPQCDGVGAFYY